MDVLTLTLSIFCLKRASHSKWYEVTVNCSKFKKLTQISIFYEKSSFPYFKSKRLVSKTIQNLFLLFSFADLNLFFFWITLKYLLNNISETRNALKYMVPLWWPLYYCQLKMKSLNSKGIDKCRWRSGNNFMQNQHILKHFK